MSQIQPKVSVIIPVYKAEPYIEKCVRSLFGQTLDSLQYIFIDDSSPDNSIRVVESVLKEYPDRKSQVIILKNEINKGVGQTRQRGIDASTGEYIIHCDPDDWVEVDMYKKLYSRAKETDADVVICDFTEEHDGRTIYINQEISDSKTVLFHQIVSGSVHCSLCNKLIKSDIVKKFRISPGINLWEDMSVIPCVLIDSIKLEKVNDALYHYYVGNSSSVTHENRYKNSCSKINAIKSLTLYLNKSGHLKNIDIIDLYELQLSAKRGLLSILSKDNLELWNITFPDANDFYLKTDLSIKAKILTYLAKNHHLRILKIFGKANKIFLSIRKKQSELCRKFLK